MKPPLAIDPGTTYFGWAAGDWETKRITSMGLHLMPNLQDWPPWFRQGQFHVIAESQVESKHDRATARDKLALARMTGACTARGGSSEIVEPRTWKGMTKKTASHSAILRAMHPEELHLYQTTCNNYTGPNKQGEHLVSEELDLDSRYDISHACGILLWRFKRFVL